MTRLGRDDISVVEEYNERRVVVRLQPCQGDENMLEMPRSPQARRGQDTATRDRENVEWWCVGGITCIGGALQAQVIAGRHKVGGLVWVPRSPRCLPTRVQAHTHTQTHTHTHTHTHIGNRQDGLWQNRGVSAADDGAHFGPGTWPNAIARLECLLQHA